MEVELHARTVKSPPVALTTRAKHYDRPALVFSQGHAVLLQPATDQKQPFSHEHSTAIQPYQPGQTARPLTPSIASSARVTLKIPTLVTTDKEPQLNSVCPMKLQKQRPHKGAHINTIPETERLSKLFQIQAPTTPTQNSGTQLQAHPHTTQPTPVRQHGTGWATYDYMTEPFTCKICQRKFHNPYNAEKHFFCH
jgi:hypothetical protein